ncbi:MAG TPA: peroxiredoxin [Patescibacteria group bacterium]|nr:peroxiredoxin [Patescibacteria group bacterium]
MKKRLTVFAFALMSLATAPFAVAADMPQPGSPAPAFSLPNQDGRDTALSDFTGKWVVLYFYPKDFTTGCSLEAHNFQEDLAEYEKRNAVILGVSMDSPESHKSFCAKEGLNFLLLADKDGRVSTLYGSTLSVMGNVLSARNTFLIGPDGVIRKTYKNVNPATHSDELLADIDALKN